MSALFAALFIFLVIGYVFSIFTLIASFRQHQRNYGEDMRDVGVWIVLIGCLIFAPFVLAWSELVEWD